MNHLGEVEGVFFCSGARNHLLLNQFHRFPLYMEIDERIASYKALGLSKARNKLTVICTTSGTAVSECLSAFIEAYYSDAPILLVSADRPLNLRNSGAPQTIDHEVITRGYRKEYLDLDLDEFHQLDFTKLQLPAHINVRITNQDEKGNHKLDKSVSDFKSFMNEIKNPLFIFSHDSSDMRPLIEKFMPYGLPFYAEVTTGAKELSPIKTEKKLLKLFNQGAFDGVVRIGHTPLNKLWRMLEGKRLPIYNFDSRGLKGLGHGNVEKISIRKLQSYAPFWNWLPHKDELIEDDTVGELHLLCKKFPSSEVAIIKALHDQIPSGSKVYLGNSLPIRYFDLIQEKKFQIMANRGVNGIDGQLATAQGWSLSTQDTVYCILGDMTLSYDLSSFLSFPSNLKCIVINNSGGRIFETLQLDHRLVMEHQRNFKQIATGFGLRYSSSLKDLSEAQVIELSPDLNESKEFLKEWCQ